MNVKRLFAFVVVLVLVFASVSSEASIFSEIKKLGEKGKELYEKNKDKIDDAVKKGQAIYKAYKGEDDEDENEEPAQQTTTKKRRRVVQEQNQPAQNQQKQLGQLQGGPTYGGGNDRLIKSSTTDYPVGELENNLKVFAKNILVNNKSTFEIQLAKNETPKNAGVRYNKVCAKGQTITAGDAGNNKNYRPFCFMTADPYYTFAGGIKVGAPIRTVENFFVTRVYDMAENPGHLHFESNNRTYIDILYDENSGRITQIGFYDTRGTNSNKTRSYMRQQARSFGFGTMY